ncbi:MAG: prepilin-type N-terminal cleavage/methylation domain-containing protein [Abitibacteriaceae bacterium]|nr:prepilin-type N-terminal cleavage/methylation domain-containing protein [Abditibacteriaceae bacterium]
MSHYPAPPRTRHHAFTLIEALSIVAVVACLVLLVYPSIQRKRDNQAHFTCASNLKQTALGFALYVQDNAQKFPPVQVNSSHFSVVPPYMAAYGWADALQDYLHSTVVYHCPLTGSPVGTNPAAPNFTDYYYNSRLATINEGELNHPDQTVLLGNGNDGHDLTDARYSKASLPPAWIKDESSPAWRHSNRFSSFGLYAFVGGRVGSSVPPSPKLLPNQDATFAIK